MQHWSKDDVAWSQSDIATFLETGMDPSGDYAGDVMAERRLEDEAFAAFAQGRCRARDASTILSTEIVTWSRKPRKTPSNGVPTSWGRALRLLNAFAEYGRWVSKFFSLPEKPVAARQNS